MRLLWLIFVSSARYSHCSGLTDFIVEQLKLPLSLINHGLNIIDHGESQLLNEYGFIIVGSGSAGSVIANRLSEVSEWNVLLLEAGREPTALSDIPFIAPSLQFTDLNWGYKMEKQEGVGLSMNDQRIPWPIGKALGGSTVINYMLYVRGHKEDYNKWEKLGNPGWGYKDVFKYFLKSEDAMIAVNDTGYHGSGGYQSVQEVPFRTESAHAWVRSCQEAGYKYVDYNGEQQLGVSYVQGTIINGRRCSVEKAFLRPVKDRPNLTILTGTMATQILINPDTREAYGVKYVRKGKEYTAIAKKEVISSAGTFHSPQLLMLSGIGPKSHLDEFGVATIQDLPVGQKMYDHPTFLGLLFSVNESITLKGIDLISPKSFLEYSQRKGLYTTLGGIESFTYIKVKDDGEKLLPDIELLFACAGLHTDRGLLIRKAFSISDEAYNTFWKPLEGKPGFQVLPMLLRPKSYGHIKLVSKNYEDDPKLYGNYYTDPDGEDINTMIASIREVQRIVNTSPALQKYNAKLVPWSISGCEDKKWDSDDYWRCGLQHLSTTLYHPISTCKMGPVTDPEAVVDHQLKVHGIKKLRVADSSTVPLPLGAHMNAPTIMIGEKLSDMIKAEYN